MVEVSDDQARMCMCRGSVTIEHAVLIAVLVAAGVGMSVYFKRALCGRWRQVGDTFGYGKQYEPGTTVIK